VNRIQEIKLSIAMAWVMGASLTSMVYTYVIGAMRPGQPVSWAGSSLIGLELSASQWLPIQFMAVLLAMAVLVYYVGGEE
jgi:hypothetical protein